MVSYLNKLNPVSQIYTYTSPKITTSSKCVSYFFKIKLAWAIPKGVQLHFCFI